MLINRIFPGIFEVPEVEFMSPTLVMDADQYDSLSQDDSLALYEEKVEYLRRVEEILARM